MRKFKTRSFLAVVLVLLIIAMALLGGGGFLDASAHSEEKAVSCEQDSDVAIAPYANNEHHPYATSPYLDLRIVRKQGDTWVIKVTNTSSWRIGIDYNSLMCNENDAKTWTKLNHIEKIVLAVGESTQDYDPITGKAETHIQIKENWWAQYIAVSFYQNGIRYISYGYDLHDTTYMSVSYTQTR